MNQPLLLTLGALTSLIAAAVGAEAVTLRQRFVSGFRSEPTGHGVSWLDAVTIDRHRLVSGLRSSPTSHAASVVAVVIVLQRFVAGFLIDYQRKVSKR